MVGYGAERGIIPCACEEMFRRIESNTLSELQYKVEVSARPAPIPVSRPRAPSCCRCSLARREIVVTASASWQASMLEIYTEKVALFPSLLPSPSLPPFPSNLQLSIHE